MKIIGITGNSGSGKSTVCQLLKAYGAVIIDADQLARQVVEPGQPAYQDVVDYFGPEVLNEDQTINRRKLGQLIFTDENKRQELIAITHPRIITAMEDRLRALSAQACPPPFAVLDAPLLIEANLHLQADEVWVVTAGEDEKLKRIMERDNLTQEAALARLQAQPSLEFLRQYATHIIENNGSETALFAHIQALLKL